MDNPEYIQTTNARVTRVEPIVHYQNFCSCQDIYSNLHDKPYQSLFVFDGHIFAVFRGPTNIFSPDRDSYDLSSVTTQPVFTIHTSRNLPILPKAGIDYLNGLESVHIHQTFEINDALTGISSENRFTVRGPYNEALFVASEQSTANDRMWLGSARPFSLQMLDKTHQESLILERKPECGFCCCCRKDKLFLIVPPGDVLGFIEENFSLLDTILVLKNSSNDAIFQVSFPKWYKMFPPKELSLKVMSGGGLTQKGTISRTWNANMNHFCTNVFFVDIEMNPRLKALMVGAAFLLEYMVFQKSCGC